MNETPFVFTLNGIDEDMKVADSASFSGSEKIFCVCLKYSHILETVYFPLVIFNTLEEKLYCNLRKCVMFYDLSFIF